MGNSSNREAANFGDYIVRSLAIEKSKKYGHFGHFSSRFDLFNFQYLLSFPHQAARKGTNDIIPLILGEVEVARLRAGRFWLGPGLRGQDFVGRVNPVAEQWASVARVDDFFDAEGLGGAEG